jgi:Peptidase M15
MQISEHFTLEELSFSEAAARLGLDNTPIPIVITNLGLVATVMERIRTLLGDRPIVVHSGYRSAEVNQAVGGVVTSAHCHGLACDFVCPAFGTSAEVGASHLEVRHRIRPTYPRVRLGPRWPGARGLVIPPRSLDEALARGGV